MALNGWVVSFVTEYELRMSVAGSKGFSGLGYVNVNVMLTVIHTRGGCISKLSGDSDAACKEENYDEVCQQFSEIERTMADCMQGSRSSMTSTAAYVEDCPKLLNEKGIKGSKTRYQHHDAEVSCWRGWNLNPLERWLTAKQVGFFEACINFFMGRITLAETV
jgi:hypothetical protein